MGRTETYLVDRARILRKQIIQDGGVVSSKKNRAPFGDWIPTRMRPVSGSEARNDAMVKLAYSHELVLAAFDDSGNPVQPQQDDEFEIRVDRGEGTLTDSLTKFKITGAITEIRKRTAVQSYVIQVILEDEF